MFYVFLLTAVKFVGDAADDSRDKVSDRTKDKFRKAMMEQPGTNHPAMFFDVYVVV